VVETRRRRIGGIGALLLAVVLIIIGGYYVLRNTMGINLPELNGDAIWPIFVIILGIGLLSRVAEPKPAE
jgi:uncharacterized integral membrane protein